MGHFGVFDMADLCRKIIGELLREEVKNQKNDKKRPTSYEIGLFFGTADGIPRLRAGRVAGKTCHWHVF